MGAVLLVAGEQGMRAALPHSRVMIHQPLGGIQGQASDIEITAKEILKLRDHWMTSKEALAYGMIDKLYIHKE